MENNAAAAATFTNKDRCRVASGSPASTPPSPPVSSTAALLTPGSIGGVDDVRDDDGGKTRRLLAYLAKKRRRVAPPPSLLSSLYHPAHIKMPLASTPAPSAVTASTSSPPTAPFPSAVRSIPPSASGSTAKHDKPTMKTAHGTVAVPLLPAFRPQSSFGRVGCCSSPTSSSFRFALVDRPSESKATRTTTTSTATTAATTSTAPLAPVNRPMMGKSEHADVLEAALALASFLPAEARVARAQARN